MGFDRSILEDEDLTRARGTDAGVTDYLFDIPVGAVAGLSQAVKGLLQLGAMPIDYLANTDLLTGIDNILIRSLQKQRLQLETLHLFLHNLLYLMELH